MTPQAPTTSSSPELQAAHSRQRRADNEDGAVTVEMGIILPVFVLLILALIGFGLLYNAQITLQGAVREGVRVLAVDSGDPIAATQAAAGDLDVAVVPSDQPCEHGEPASVTATYDYSFNFMFFTVDRPLTATAVMRCERSGT